MSIELDGALVEQKLEPADFATPFNHFMRTMLDQFRDKSRIEKNDYSISIDYLYWLTLPGWNLRETAAITLLIDPDRIDELSKSTENSHVKLHKDYTNRLRFLERSVEMDLIDALNTPKASFDYLASCRMRLPVFSEFEGLFHITPTDFRSKYNRLLRKYKKLVAEKDNDELEISTRKKTLLSKMIYAMAWNSFRYTHHANNDAVSLIHKAILAAEFDGPTDDTIRGYLREAVDYLVSKNIDLPKPKKSATIIT